MRKSNVVTLTFFVVLGIVVALLGVGLLRRGEPTADEKEIARQQGWDAREYADANRLQAKVFAKKPLKDEEWKALLRFSQVSDVGFRSGNLGRLWAARGTPYEAEAKTILLNNLKSPDAGIQVIALLAYFRIGASDWRRYAQEKVDSPYENVRTVAQGLLAGRQR